MYLPYYPPKTIAIAVAWSITLVPCSKILPSARISPLALMLLLAVMLPVMFKLSLNEIVSPASPADSNLEAKTVPLALMFPLAVMFVCTDKPV